MRNDEYNGYGDRDCAAILIIVVGHDGLVPEKWPAHFRSRTRPPSSTPLYGASIVALGKFSALFPPPSSDSPPFCPLAFSRRQILKSIEFPVGQTTKLPPNNPVVGFSTLCNVDVKYILPYNFYVLLVTESNVIIINTFLYLRFIMRYSDGKNKI